MIDNSVEEIVNIFFSKKEKEIINFCFFDIKPRIYLSLALDIHAHTVLNNKRRIIKKIKDYLELYPFYISLLNDIVFLKKLECDEIQVLFYLLCCFNEKSIFKLINIPYNKLYIKKNKILLMLKEYNEDFYNKLIEIRRKYRHRK